MHYLYWDDFVVAGCLSTEWDTLQNDSSAACGVDGSELFRPCGKNHFVENQIFCTITTVQHFKGFSFNSVGLYAVIVTLRGEARKHVTLFWKGSSEIRDEM